MNLTAKKEDILSVYKTATPSIKKKLEKMYGKETFVKPKPVKKVKTILDKINSIEDVFKYCKEDYKAFLRKWKDLPESVLNYMLLTKGIATLNEGWVPDYSEGNTQEKWGNYFNLRGSGSVFSDSYNYCSDDCTAVGSALRLKNKETALHAAKIFLPQYKGHYKPKK